MHCWSPPKGNPKSLVSVVPRGCVEGTRLVVGGDGWCPQAGFWGSQEGYPKVGGMVERVL